MTHVSYAGTLYEYIPGVNISGSCFIRVHCSLYFRSYLVADVDMSPEVTLRFVCLIGIVQRTFENWYPTEQLVEPSTRPGLYLDLALVSHVRWQ